MKKYSVLLAVVALVFASLACQTIMGGGNGSTVPSDSGTAPTAPPSTDGGNTTVGQSPFPVTSDATNVVGTSETVTYQSKMNSADIIKFYQDEFGKKGYTEDKAMHVDFNGTFALGFTGHESGKKIIIGGANLGGTTTVSIALQ